MDGARWLRVTGSGPVAVAFARFLQRRGVTAERIAIDLRTEPPPALAARAIALSHGSLQLLGRIATLPRAGRIERVEVSLRGHAGRTRIRAQDLHTPELGCVVRYGALMDALRTAADACRLEPTEPAGEPALVVSADGDPGGAADVRDFEQAALLLEVEAPRADPQRRGTAFERFTPVGPLALLPLPEAGRWTVVWCDAPAACEARRSADDTTLAHELGQVFGDALGPLAVVGPRAVAPLVRRARRTLVEGDRVWIGNAAQALHPVAGQGLNLGLRDAFGLADAVAPVLLRGAPLHPALDGWQRRRRADRGVTIALTDLMAESFTWPLVRGLQSQVLAALDLVPALRRPLASQLMFGRR